MVAATRLLHLGFALPYSGVLGPAGRPSVWRVSGAAARGVATASSFLLPWQSVREPPRPWPLLSSESPNGDGGQPTAHCPPRCQPEALARFMAWLLEQGADIPPDTLSLEWRPDSGLGLYCLRPVSKDAIVVSLPPSLPLSPSLPPSWPDEEGGLSSSSCLSSLARLALRLLYEKHCCSPSRYGPYLSVLPGVDELRDLPLLWPASQLQLLGPPPLLQDVLELRATVELERRTILRRLLLTTANQGQQQQQQELAPLIRVLRAEEEEPGRRPGEWWWARAIVMSRPYYMEEGDEESLRLLPLLDMLNHDDGVAYAVLPGDGVFVPRSAVTLTADRDYGPGQQLLGSYGQQLSSASKLYSFGYLDPPWTPPTSSQDATSGLGGGGSKPLPMQGTAFFVLSLQSAKEGEEAWKSEVLRHVGLSSEAQRVEVAARLVEEQDTQDGSRRRRMVLEEYEGQQALGQLLRYVGLKWHQGPAPEALARGPEAVVQWWGGSALLGGGRAVEEVVELCRQGEADARARLQRAAAAAAQDGSSGRVAGVLCVLYEGELAALRAVREAAALSLSTTAARHSSSSRPGRTD